MPPLIKKVELPDTLRPYTFHGVDLQYRTGQADAVADCPFCGRANKFAVKVESGLWRCLVCNEGSDNDKAIKGGNPMVFIRLLYKLSQELMVKQSIDCRGLANDRGFVSDHVIQTWGLVRSAITKEWLIPGYNSDGNLCQLYRYAKVQGKMRLLASPKPAFTHQIHGMNLWGKSKQIVYICEGPWDAMALYEVMSQTKRTENGLAPTGAIRASLYNEANILAFPGCTTFNENWAKLLKDKHVVIVFDNDHPIKNAVTGSIIPPAALTGAKRLTEILSSKSSTAPKTIQYLRWGPEGYDLSLPSGTDLRDTFKEAGDSIGPRIKALDGILGKISDAPPEWLNTPSGGSSSSSKKASTKCTPCTSYRELTNAWRKALKWTEGLDCALSVMLASVASVRLVGDQLWIKIIGPASCLDGDTLIYDPVNETELSVRERTALQEKFFVYSLNQEGELIINQALPPQEYIPTPMYEVTFESGKTIIVTGGHEFWNGQSYVSLQSISSYLENPEYDVYPLPTISDTDLLIRKQDVLHSKQKVEDCQFYYPDDSCSCDELPLRELENVRCSSQLPNDVRVSDEFCYSRINESLHNRQELLDDRSSNYRGPSHASSSPTESLIEPHTLLSNDERYCRSFLTDDNIRKEKPRLNRDQLVIECEPQSNVERKQPDYLKESYLHELEKLEAETLSPSESNRPDRVEHKDQSFPDSNLSFEEDEIEFHSTLNNVVKPPDHNESIDNIQQKTFQIDTNLQVLVDDPEPNLNEQPYYTSIEEGINLGSISLTETDGIVNIKFVGNRNYYDFHVPSTQNYWAEGFFHHNCGKSTLCEALSTNGDYVIAKSTVRGFHSGYGDGGEDDCSLISQIKDKTLITKDGDTLLQSPNLSQILSEARDLYDTVSRTSYRNKASRDYVGIRTTWLLCGTSSLRSIDSSELGERFLDCVIMEGIDDELEDEILARVANRVIRNMSVEVSEKSGSQQEPEMEAVMKLTGGYVEWLRKNAATEMAQVNTSDEAAYHCTRLGKFVAFMRARPSTRQDETAEREFAARLVSQHLRLATCLAVVMNRKSVDEEVLRRTRKVALDTARGKTLEIARHLYEAGAEGLEVRSVTLFMSSTDGEMRKLLKFLKQIGVAEVYTRKPAKGITGKPAWKLTERMSKLWKEVHGLE